MDEPMPCPRCKVVEQRAFERGEELGRFLCAAELDELKDQLAELYPQFNLEPASVINRLAQGLRERWSGDWVREALDEEHADA